MNEYESYNVYLKQGIAALFRHQQNNGFWDEAGGRIIKRLILAKDQRWQADGSFDLRYGPFGLMGVLYWRYKNPEADNTYDEKIKRYLAYLIKHLGPKEIADSSQYSGINYGILSSLALGYLIFQDQSYLNKAWEIFNFNKNHFKKIRHNILSLALWGEGWLYEALGGDEVKRAEVKNDIKKQAAWFISTQDRHGYFQTGDFRSAQLARTMYVLWGLGKAAFILGEKKWLKNIEKTIDHILASQQTSDGAFLWHPKFYLTKLPFLPFKIPIYFPSGANWLFECHQTFFVNAVEQYKQAGGTKDYLAQEIRAINWIFGQNRIKKDLAAISGIQIPIRVMDLEGKTFIPAENFKGTYEIGSYIMALTDLIIRLKKI
jgi:hypothetical protein